MPTVGKKKFPYTEKGKAAAKKAAAKRPASRGAAYNKNMKRKPTKIEAAELARLKKKKAKK